jgi:dipeptidyl aminopeptidase/acylaminoacyl peptidase
MAVAWSPDGKRLASASHDGTIRVWELGAGKEVHRLVGHDSIVDAVAWSPDGKRLASGGADTTVRLWDVATGKEIGRWDGHKDRVRAVAWSPDGKRLASASNDATVRLWEVATGSLVRRFVGHEAAVDSLDWSPDGRRLASAGGDTTLLLWAVRDHPDERPTRPGLVELNACWADLAGDDAARAYDAIRALTRGAGHSVAFLAERLKPAAAADPKRIARLIDDLDHDQFAVRQQADDELSRLHEFTEAALRDRLRGQPSAELRRRIEQLLSASEGQRLTPESLRALRALEVLEYVGSAEAKRVLAALAAGAKDCRLTREAQASLDRLNK